LEDSFSKEPKMDLQGRDGGEARRAEYLSGLMSVIGNADRVDPLRDYCVGLMMPVERKSVEPMAAVTAPDRTAAQHQSLPHFVRQAPWSDREVLAKVHEVVPPAVTVTRNCARRSLRWD
jgi:SRSO17 transposase